MDQDAAVPMYNSNISTPSEIALDAAQEASKQMGELKKEVTSLTLLLAEVIRHLSPEQKEAISQYKADLIKNDKKLQKQLAKAKLQEEWEVLYKQFQRDTKNEDLAKQMGEIQDRIEKL